MANIAGYKPLTDPNWISIQFDDGTESPPVNDPNSEYRTQVDEIARKVAGVPPDPMKAATASLGSELVGGASAGIAKADVPPSLGISAVGAVSPPVSGVPAAAADAGGDGFAAVGKALGKQAMKGAAMGQQGVGGPGAPPPVPGPSQPAPVAPPAPAKPPGLMVTDTTSSWQHNKSEQRGTTGISEADRPGVVAAQEGAVKSAEVANEADYAARANQLWTEWGRYSDQAKSRIAEKAALQEQELKFNESLQGAYKSLDAVAARKVDPAQAFAGEKGWYAFMAGFGDVLRNVGAALAGKAPVVDPGAVMDQLVERSVNLQLAQKEADYKAGRIGIERLTADRETTRHRLGLVITQLAESELGKAQSQQSYQALGALKAKGDAIVADARAKAAAALARQETITQSTSDVSGGTVQRGLPKPADASAGIELAGKKLDARKKLEEAGATPDQLREFDARNNIETPGGESTIARTKRVEDETFTEAQAKAESAHSAVKDVAIDAGLVRENGKWVVGSGPVPPAFVQKLGEAASLGIYQGSIKPKFDAAVEAYGRQQSGGVIGKDEVLSEDQKAGFIEQLGGQTMTRQQLAERLNAAESNIESKRPRERRKEGNATPPGWKSGQ